MPCKSCFRNVLMTYRQPYRSTAFWLSHGPIVPPQVHARLFSTACCPCLNLKRQQYLLRDVSNFRQGRILQSRPR